MRDELAEKKRREVIEAAEAGAIADPISGSLIFSMVVSAAFSIGASAVTRACAPPKGGRDAGRE